MVSLIKKKVNKILAIQRRVKSVQSLSEVDEAEDNLTADEALEAVLENAEEHPVEE